MALCVLGAALGAAGCGDDPDTVDAGQIEQQIQQDLSSANLKISSVSCPDGVVSDTGARFTCDAKLAGGGEAKVEVTEVEAPDRFTYSVKPGSVVLPGAKVDKAVEQQLAAAGLPNATVDCPDPVKVKPGTTVTCSAAGAGGGVGSVSFEFSDAAGSVDSSSVETGGSK
jgi:hypothetical protein